jgi:hypothetical protein
MSDVREIFLRAIARADELTAASVLHPATLPFRTLMYPLWLCAVAWQVLAVIVCSILAVGSAAQHRNYLRI